MYLAQNLKYLREKNGEFQRDIAEMLGVSKPTAGRYESGECEPNLDILVKLAEHFGVKVDDLLRKDLRPPKPMYADNIVHLCHAYGIKKEEIAQMLNLKNSRWIDLVISGEKELSINQLIFLADFFDITLDQFVKLDLSEVGNG